MSLAPSPSRRRFDFFPPRPCFVCPRPAAANSYIRIFADGSSTGWKIGWPCCPLGCYTRGPRGKEGGGLSSFLPKIEARKKKGGKKEEIGREGARDIGVCLLRTRPKNRALKAPRLLETLGATFSIGVWHGRMRRDNASWLPRMSIFSLFSRVFGKRSKSVLLISSFPLPFFHFSSFFRYSFAILLPRGKTRSIPPCFFVWSSVAIFLPLKTMWKRGHRGIRGIRIGLTWRAYKVDVKGRKGFGLYFVSFYI